MPRIRILREISGPPCLYQYPLALLSDRSLRNYLMAMTSDDFGPRLLTAEPRRLLSSVPYFAAADRESCAAGRQDSARSAPCNRHKCERPPHLLPPLFFLRRFPAELSALGPGSGELWTRRCCRLSCCRLLAYFRYQARWKPERIAHWAQVLQQSWPIVVLKNVGSNQCCGSGVFIPDPDFYPSRIPDLGSRLQKQQQKRG
jgi:hypothetical protein